jgi:DNA-binding response OmpR family regulator
MRPGLAILVVDDEFEIAELLAELLAERGHRVTTAANGLVGQALLARHDYDLVIADFMMPIIDGVQLVQAMRAEPRLASVPVIMISAQLDVMSGAADGLVQGMLQKPFSPKALYAAIDRAIAASGPAPTEAA